MDPVAHLFTKNAVYEAVLRQAREPLKGHTGNHGVEVMTVSADVGARSGNPGLDAGLQLLRSGGGGTCGHTVSVAGGHGYTD